MTYYLVSARRVLAASGSSIATTKLIQAAHLLTHAGARTRVMERNSSSYCAPFYRR
jgi:hypothetical protein